MIKEYTMPGRAWGELEEQQLVEMLKDGSTPREVGLVLGRTVDACRRKSYRCRVKVGRRGRPPNVERHLAVLELIDKGLSLNAVGRQLGIAVGSVWEVVLIYMKSGVLIRSGGQGSRCRYELASWWKVSAVMSENGQKKWDKLHKELECLAVK